MEKEKLVDFGMKLAEKCMISGSWKLDMEEFVDEYIENKKKGISVQYCECAKPRRILKKPFWCRICKKPIPYNK